MRVLLRAHDLLLERKERILESLSHYYGDEAKNPVVYYESDWGSEEGTSSGRTVWFEHGGESALAS